jgi:hypothetical protein
LVRGAAAAEATLLSLEPEFSGLRHFRPFAPGRNQDSLSSGFTARFACYAAFVSLLTKSGGGVGHVGEDIDIGHTRLVQSPYFLSDYVGEENAGFASRFP